MTANKEMSCKKGGRITKWDAAKKLGPENVDGLAEILTEDICKSLKKLELELIKAE
ncbi:MAG: hypothetical protein U9R75_09250 [Candidatus Thermoplasmatota archaeon]|nr:hypothetical protein [Candidatus Thermoplasmatota archaeon]